ncbi:hypothetical protein TrVFT333_009025 [Trichoderma virens FT-333]|nr:hypothetical protein TrVFT333_009025 [Trichoderma virens FT-333]
MADFSQPSYSKLEQLEQELRSIQKVVNTKNPNGESACFRPRAVLNRPDTSTASHVHPTRWTAISPPEKKQKKVGPTEARVLGSILISGQDVEYYFSKFLQHFHPFLPILRRKEPDECYEAQPMLFWAVLYVASRRYAKDGQLFGALVEHMTKNLWTMMSRTVLGLDEIHTILLVCAWPYPTIRFVTDPSSMFAAIAMNACVSLGLHTGRGSHPQFCVGSRHGYTSTDEEASSTWIACCLISQRTSASAGHPPPFIQHSDTRCKAALESNYWADLLATYELQRFLNRFHMAMHAQTSTVGSIPESAVAVWENEFEVLKPLIIRFDTEISRVLKLAALLEIQLFYFMSPSTITATNNNLIINANTAIVNPPPPSPSSSTPAPSSNPSLRINTLKAFTTARSLILTALDLDSRSKFISHCPGILCRALTDAANTIVYLLHSVWGPDSDALSPTRPISSPSRPTPRSCAAPSYVPKFDSVPPSWVSRGAAGITYACLERFKNGLLMAQKSTDGVNKCLEIIQFRTDQSSGTNTVAQDQPMTNNVPASDPFQDVDWSMFMDDFGWTGEDGVLMSLI